MQPVTKFYASFPSASGRTRYVGEGRTMPFTKEEAELFDTKAEAAAKLASIATHHRREGAKGSVGSRKVMIVRSIVETMLTGRS